ncbi:hypothetical protein JAAARDRAFT_48337 [Jaapia argillacea MUCL 33604]|uniref:Uncharacterized protein n=1 Tax=Jaapia argillacea MUCL 33604 TaxID=933084 RepID=A0A067PRQ2_9AGAM|nr:hypothetical protein JAAARDRAFT_48337 [Jaapia argillacea MUCL 33604]
MAGAVDYTDLFDNDDHAPDDSEGKSDWSESSSDCSMEEIPNIINSEIEEVEAVQLQRTHQLKANLEGEEKPPKVLDELAVILLSEWLSTLQRRDWNTSTCESRHAMRYST